MAIHSKKTRTTIQDAIRDLQNFKAPATLTGEWSDYVGFTGHLGSELQDLMRKHAKSGDIYIVRSYATPIAWYTEHHGWYETGEKHSITTTNHQHAISLAIAGHLTW